MSEFGPDWRETHNGRKQRRGGRNKSDRKEDYKSCDAIYVRSLEKANTIGTESGSVFAPGLGVARGVDRRWGPGKLGGVTEVPPNWNIVTITQLNKFNKTHHALEAEKLLASDGILVDRGHLPMTAGGCVARGLNSTRPSKAATAFLEAEVAHLGFSTSEGQRAKVAPARSPNSRPLPLVPWYCP